MRFIVPTLQRTGSTLVCRALRLLTGEPITYVEVPQKRLEILQEHDGIIKTHDLAPVDLLKYLVKAEQTIVIGTSRAFLPALCSKLLYEKNVRPVEGLPLDTRIDQTLQLLGETTDAGFLNIFIEANPQWVLDHARKWRRACVTVLNNKVKIVPFEKVCNDYERLWDMLIKFVEEPKVTKTDFVDLLDFNHMQSQYTPGFLRSGGAEDYRRLLDNSSISLIEKVVSQVKSESVL